MGDQYEVLGDLCLPPPPPPPPPGFVEAESRPNSDAKNPSEQVDAKPKTIDGDDGENPSKIQNPKLQKSGKSSKKAKKSEKIQKSEQSKTSKASKVSKTAKDSKKIQKSGKKGKKNLKKKQNPPKSKAQNPPESEAQNPTKSDAQNPTESQNVQSSLQNPDEENSTLLESVKVKEEKPKKEKTKKSKTKREVRGKTQETVEKNTEGVTAEGSPSTVAAVRDEDKIPEIYTALFDSYTSSARKTIIFIAVIGILLTIISVALMFVDVTKFLPDKVLSFNPKQL